MKFAAIDAGSNAIRLLLARVIEDGKEPFFKKESLIRMPLRLGDDAFVRKRISDRKASDLLETIRGFACLMTAYRPLRYRACATSAMREACNGRHMAARVHQETGILLEIIDGSEEAAIIYANHIEQRLPGDGSCLYIDVGGGSTELTVFVKGDVTATSSFDIGTVRMLEGLVTDERWREMKRWIKRHAASRDSLVAVGSGGNINKLFRLAQSKEGKPLGIRKLRALNDRLSSLDVDQRIREFNLRPDRADVIVPASTIFLSTMRWAGIDKIFVPEVGLADGIIHQLYLEHTDTRMAGRPAAGRFQEI